VLEVRVSHTSRIHLESPGIGEFLEAPG